MRNLSYKTSDHKLSSQCLYLTIVNIIMNKLSKGSVANDSCCLDIIFRDNVLLLECNIFYEERRNKDLNGLLLS